MDAKGYLETVRRAEQELRLLAVKRQHYEELAGLTSTLSDRPEGGSKNPTSRVETAAVNIADLTAEIDAITPRYVNFIKESEKLLDEVSQFNFRKILTLKYFLGKSWNEINEEMGYKDKKSVFRVHGYALKEFEKVLTNHHLT